MLALIKRRPFVLEIGDLWPAFITGLGQMRRSFVIRLLERIELFMYRNADQIVCVTNSYKEILVARGVPESKLRVIYNGAEVSTFTPGRVRDNIRESYNPTAKFVVGYFGTMGAAHGLENVIAAAKHLDEVLFLFVGDGVARDRLQELARGADNIVFVDSQPRSAMPDFWRLCDLALVHLRDVPAMTTVVPSKMFEAMCTGVPILLSAPVGEAARFLKTNDCGCFVEAGSPDKLVDAIEALRGDPEERSRLGANGRRVAMTFSRENQAAAMLQALESVCPSPRPV
jgi:glycosyltransferase involved in cell wall biosynthesis